VAFHLQSDSIQSICTPDTIDRSVSDFEVSRIRDVLSKHIPSLNGELLATATCMYTVTDDEHFFIDFHPKNSNILLVSPCSGHGFKFCSVVGEIVSDLVLQQTTAHDISLFRSRERGERFLDSLGSTHQL
jgi:sarcosine oxidase